MVKNIKQVSVLMDTGSSWGRGAIKGVMAYEHKAGPWYLKIRNQAVPRFTKIPEGCRADGYIANVDNQELAEELKQTGCPVVNLADCDLEGFSAPNLRTNDAIGAQLAVDHFKERGFQNLAFAGPTKFTNAVEYKKHFQLALADENIIPRSSFAYDGSDTEMFEHLTEWLHELPKPAGILAWGHGYARAIVDACMLSNISVPHDIAVLSASNDNFMCDACYPPLSGIRSPMKRIGYHAAKLLDEMMTGKKIPHDITYFAPNGVEDRLSTDALAVADPQLRNVIAYMKTHAHEAITIADVLAAVPMARSSLEQRFRKEFGLTPAEEMRRFRINKARKLLAETDLPMQDIAEACGFSSYNYLSFAFKKVTGVPPQEYRKSVKV